MTSSSNREKEKLSKEWMNEQELTSMYLESPLSTDRLSTRKKSCSRKVRSISECRAQSLSCSHTTAAFMSSGGTPPPTRTHTQPPSPSSPCWLRICDESRMDIQGERGLMSRLIPKEAQTSVSQTVSGICAPAALLILHWSTSSSSSPPLQLSYCCITAPDSLSLRSLCSVLFNILCSLLTVTKRYRNGDKCRSGLPLMSRECQWNHHIFKPAEFVALSGFINFTCYITLESSRVLWSVIWGDRIRLTWLDRAPGRGFIVWPVLCEVRSRQPATFLQHDSVQRAC